MPVLVADIGGTNARFAIAKRDDNGEIELSQIMQFPVSRFENLTDCLTKYREDCEAVLPKRAVIAVAAPTGKRNITFTNSGWSFDTAEIKDVFDFDEFECINDFVAVAYAVANAKRPELQSLLGPRLVEEHCGVTTVLGPGTGLGVSYFTRSSDSCHVQETEAAHIGFSPTDDFEELLYRKLRSKFGRVSAERVAAGAGLREIYNQLTDQRSTETTELSDAALWNRCLNGSDSLSKDAINRYCGILGLIAGDIILAQGASRLVLAGSIASKLTDIIPQTGFYTRFVAKGRFENLMGDIPIQFLDCDQPGLTGAAHSAFPPTPNDRGAPIS